MKSKTVSLCAVLGLELLLARPSEAGIFVPAAPKEAAVESAMEKSGSVLPYVLRAKKATAWRLEAIESPLYPGTAKPGEKKRRTIGRASQARILSPAELSRLQAELGKPENFGSGFGLCDFNPALAVLFEGEDFSLELRFCFLCDDLEASLNGEYVKTVPINPGRAAFLAFFKAVFPSDKLIQSLPLNNPDKTPESAGKKSK